MSDIHLLLKDPKDLGTVLGVAKNPKMLDNDKKNKIKKLLKDPEDYNELMDLIVGNIDRHIKKLHEDMLGGGLADGKSSELFDQGELEKGIAIEREHSSDPNIAKEIAMDHLSEDPKYYIKLARMESEGMIKLKPLLKEQASMLIKLPDFNPTNIEVKLNKIAAEFGGKVDPYHEGGDNYKLIFKDESALEKFLKKAGPMFKSGSVKIAESKKNIKEDNATNNFKLNHYIEDLELMEDKVRSDNNFEDLKSIQANYQKYLDCLKYELTHYFAKKYTLENSKQIYSQLEHDNFHSLNIALKKLGYLK